MTPADRQPDRPMLVTNSGLPEAHFVREAAIAWLAFDALLGHDSHMAENALAWARALMDAHQHEAHDGDCTNQPMTCLRCLCDDAIKHAEDDE